jgi:hypothetical protein
MVGYIYFKDFLLSKCQIDHILIERPLLLNISIVRKNITDKNDGGSDESASVEYKTNDESVRRTDGRNNDRTVH